MTAVRRSFFLLLTQNYYTVALEIAGTLIVSRLLTPTEIGIYSVAAVLAALAGQLRDFGLQEYIIQGKDLSTNRIRAAFGMNIITSWTMAILFMLASQPVGEFYGEPGITIVMRIQSINFVLVPFGAITMAYFRRQINYRPMLVAGILSSTISFAISISLVLSGFSYLSLAWSSLAGIATGVAVSFYFRPKDFPRWPSFRGLGAVIQFSKHAMSIYVLGQIGKAAPPAVIGRVLDVASVAYFSRANGLMEIFNRAVLRPTVEICLPYFSKALREGQETRIGYLQATTLLTGIGWSFFAVMGILAYAAIRLLYGPQWISAVALAQILCLVAMVELLYWLAAEVMIAEGRIDQSNRQQFVVQTLRLCSVLLVFPFGLIGVGWGLLLAALIGALVSQHFLNRVIGLYFTDLLKACKPSAYVTFFAALPAAVITYYFGQNEDNFLVIFFGAGLASAVAWLLALKLFHHPFWKEIAAIAAKASRKHK